MKKRTGSYMEALQRRLLEVHECYPAEARALLHSVKSEEAARRALVRDDEEAILKLHSDWSCFVSIVIKGLVKHGLLVIDNQMLVVTPVFDAMMTAYRAIVDLEQTASASEFNSGAILLAVFHSDTMKTALNVCTETMG